LVEIHRLGLRPTVIGLEYSHDYQDNMQQMAQCIEFFDRVVLESLK
jgi:hypothetical protein